ncbi:hypothetical protein ACYOEI_14050 [Singulisphaera rosea]
MIRLIIAAWMWELIAVSAALPSDLKTTISKESAIKVWQRYLDEHKHGLHYRFYTEIFPNSCDKYDVVEGEVWASGTENLRIEYSHRRSGFGAETFIWNSSEYCHVNQKTNFPFHTSRRPVWDNQTEKKNVLSACCIEKKDWMNMIDIPDQNRLLFLGPDDPTFKSKTQTELRSDSEGSAVLWFTPLTPELESSWDYMTVLLDSRSGLPSVLKVGGRTPGYASTTYVQQIDTIEPSIPNNIWSFGSICISFRRSAFKATPDSFTVHHIGN